MPVFRFRPRGDAIRLRVLTISALLMVVVPTGITAFGVGCTQEEKTAEQFHCPMHPTYVSDVPGDCPICGMRLVPIKTETVDAMSEQPAGQAGDSGGAPGEIPSRERQVLFYRSPMDPSITSHVPAKDEMGMDFVPVYAEPNAATLEVPGHSPVSISPEGLRLAGIRTAPATRGSITRTIRAVGLVQADERRIHQVTLKSTGYVERLFVGTTGQFVRKNEPILSVYSPDLLAAQTDFLHARQAAEDLSASEMPEVREGAEDLLRASRERLALLDVPEGMIHELERSGTPQRTVTFTAPVSGYVTAKPVFAGMRAEPGTELYTVTDLSRVWIEADVYEYEASLLKLGQEARITLPYDPAVSMTGKVSLIYPQVDQGSRTLRVRFETDNPGLTLKPGMYANTEIEIQTAEGIIVPDNAVLDTGDRQLVFVETAPGEFSPRAVRVGLRGDGRALLLEGVEESEAVVVRANFLLDSESRIRAAFSGTAK